jgi:hypothetical protein
MLLEKLRSHVESLPENNAPKFELRMSSAGECPRKLDYDIQVGPGQTDFKAFMRMSLGTAAHTFLQVVIKETLQDDFHGAEKECVFFLGSIPVVGHPDGQISSLKATLELKSVSDNTFRMIKNQNIPLPQHIDQANLYASVVGDQNVLIVYINRDTGDMEEFMFPTDEALARAIKSKFMGVLERSDKKELHKRPYADASEAPCWYCPHVTRCYEGFSAEVEARGTAKVSHPDLVQNVRSAIIHRNTRLVSEKLEEAMKEYIGKEMANLDLKHALIATSEDAEPEAKVIVTVGKKNNTLVTVKELKNGK